MSTGYGWEGIRQVCATLLSARHVPERLCGRACLQRGAITSVRPLPFLNIFKHLRVIPHVNAMRCSVTREAQLSL